MVFVPENKKFGPELLRVNSEAGEESRDHTMKSFVSYVKDFEIYYYTNKFPSECLTICPTVLTTFSHCLVEHCKLTINVIAIKTEKR